MDHECNKGPVIDMVVDKLERFEARLHDGDVMFQKVDGKMDQLIESHMRIEKKVDYTNGCVGRHDGYFTIMKWSCITGTAVFIFMLMADSLGWAEAVIQFGGK